MKRLVLKKPRAKLKPRVAEPVVKKLSEREIAVQEGIRWARSLVIGMRDNTTGYSTAGGMIRATVIDDVVRRLTELLQENEA